MLWIVLVVVLLNLITVIFLVTRYLSEVREIQKLQNEITNQNSSTSSLSQNYSELLKINDKITTMLGTKDPLAFQAVQGMSNNGNSYATVEYVDPSDEAEARRVNDLTRPGRNTSEQDDELPDEHIQSEWNSWDDPSFIARTIAEGS
jgi:hypothetical protein